MLTIEALREFGAAVDEGLARCMKNEAFYLRMVNMALADGSFGKLERAIGAGDLDAAFEACHALKGILGNVSLTPMYAIAIEMTEQLRGRTEMDYHPALDRMLAMREELRALAE